MTGRFEDDRGVIQDLITEPVDAVTLITTVKDAIRGNHYHRETRQITYVLNGSLQITNGLVEKIIGSGEMVVHEPGDPHAWKALEDTACLVFTRGPRSGENYASDTFRLDKPLL